MDERETAIREKLSSVKNNFSEMKHLEEQVAAVLKTIKAKISGARSTR
jgi:F-type H+-transporting ATPase subunit b